ncbi:MAG TPA: hypothetical protein VNF47_28860 [Streptosporangiaceae bacterium]|nr:hypothetical protein [Streptosporangiaceae bacterium]
MNGAATAYRRLFGAAVAAAARLPPALAEAWGAPGAAGVPVRLLTAASGGGLIRLVHSAGTSAQPFRCTGWAASEWAVADVDVMTRRASQVGFTVLVEPGPVGAGGHLRALQASGAGGEGIYLTEITSVPPGFRLPSGRGSHGVLYGAVLGAADLPAARGFFEDGFEVTRVTDHPLPVRAINLVHSLPAGTRHRVSTLQLGGRAILEIDQYPVSATPRPRNPGEVPPGIVAMTFLAGCLPAAAGHLLPARPEPPYLGRPAWSRELPDGGVLEVVAAR